MIKILLRFIVFLFLLMVVFGLLLSTIAATETGSQWFVNWLIKTNDVPLTIKSIEGRFLDKLTLNGLHYNDHDVNDISLARMELNWSAADLVQFKARIKKLMLTDLVVHSKSQKKSDETFHIATLEFPSLPIKVSIDNFSLNKAQFYFDDTALSVQGFKSSMILNDEQLSFQLDELSIDEQHFTGSVRLTDGVMPKIEAEVNWAGIIDKESGKGRLMVNGVQNNLDIQANIDSAIEMLLKGKLDLNSKSAMSELHGEIKGKLFDSISETVVFDTPLNFHVKGDMKQFSMQVNANAHTTAEEKFKISFNTEAVLPKSVTDGFIVNINWTTTPEHTGNPLLMLKGQGDFTLLDHVLTINHDLHVPELIKLRGKIDLSSRALDLAMDWDAIDLILSETDVLQLKAGLIKADGKLDAISLLFQTQYLIDSKNGKASVLDLSESHYANLSVIGKLNLLTTHPIGQLTGNLTTPVPSALAGKIDNIGLINFTLNSDLESADLNIDSSIITNKGRHFDLGLKSDLDLSSNTSEKSMLFNWFLRSGNDKDIDNNATGQGSVQYKPKQISISHQSNTPYSTTLQGDIMLNEEITLNLDLDWQNIVLPIDNLHPLASNGGKIHLEGPLTSLMMNANGRFKTEPVGLINLDLNALWSESTLTVKALDVDVLDGKINMQGVVNLLDSTKGNFKLDANNINFGKINPDLESQLMISSVFEFNDTKDGISSMLNIDSISGQWRGFPVNGKGELVYARDNIRIDQLHLESGNNKLDLNLNIDESLQGQIDLSMQDLSIFSSDFAGNMQGRLGISGKPDTPRIEGKLIGNEIYLNDVRIASFIADTHIDLSPQQHSSLLVQLNTLSYQNTIIDKVIIRGKGLTESHNIELTASSPELEIKSSINGSLENKHWSAQLNQFDFKNNEFGDWRLSEKTSLDWEFKNNIFNISKTCLSQNEADFCLSTNGELTNSISGNVILNQLPLKLAKPWLPETLNLNGSLTGKVNFSKDDKTHQLEVSLKGNNTQVVLGFEDNIELLDIEDASFKASVNGQHQEMNLNLKSSQYFDMSLFGRRTNDSNNPLSIDLELNFEQLDWLEKLEPALSGSHGKMKTKIVAKGTLDQPEVTGQFSLQDGQISILPIGLILDKIDGFIESNNQNNEIQISAILGSQSQELLIKGNAKLLPDEGYPYEFTLVGNEFPLIRTADISMDISPELSLKGTQELHYIKGKVTVPLLDIIMSSVPESAVSISPDTIIVQSKKSGAVHIDDGDAENNFIKNHVDINVSVYLDPEMHIQGFGLDTRLTGDINILKPISVYLPSGEGLVTVKEGSYRAYGQNLTIEKGVLQFAGPIDNPSLDIRAFRPKLSVKAGVSVTGSVREPELTLYSEPKQTEADTLSYLITGQPISGASGTQGSLIAQAALSLGSKQSSVLTNQIKDMFHLDDFSVGGGDSVDSTSFSASKRLSPKLTFRSSFNPFDQLWSFLLDYKLTDNWSVQTESGVTQGADIVYSIESNTFQDLYNRFLDLVRF